MKTALNKSQIREFSEITIGHYDRVAENYWHGTRDHDVSQNREALLEAIEGEAPHAILDIGCGTGLLGQEILSKGFVKIDGTDFSTKMLEKAAEKNIYQEQAKSSKKPKNVIEQIIEGKMDKYFQEICLLEQPFIKDPDKTVKDLITESIATLGENITVGRYTRFAIGESHNED